ncbi:MAG: glycosyltransferase [Acidobacteria bacterium]|nr:glycosyltransferase [Acidobacteriota bacterium]
MSKICFVVASPLTVKAFLLGPLALLEGDELVVVADLTTGETIHGVPFGTRCHPVRIERKISPLRDLWALVGLFRFMRRERFDLVCSQTPKAGLLAMLAARAAGVPLRIHTFTGQVWATRRGFSRAMLKALDRITAWCSTEVLIDSPSQRAFLLGERVVDARRSRVIEDGSVSGVDTSRFRPDAVRRLAMRERLGVADSEFVIVFVGRMCVEKGVLELLEAFKSLHSAHPDTRLVLVGPDEEGIVPTVRDVEGVLVCGYTDRPEEYLVAADVFCLPSHREGFGSVIIEAAACGVPGIGSRVYGICDAIVDGETGLLHAVRDPADLMRCLTTLVEDGALRARLGSQALERARTRFSSERVVGAFVQHLRGRLAGA